MLATLAIALAATAGLNYRVDPSGLFDDGAAATRGAEFLIGGQAIGAVNLDDRELVRAYSRLVPTTPDVVVLGSSRALQIRSDLFGRYMFNAGVTSASLADILAIVELFTSRDGSSPSFVFVLDTWLLGEQTRNNRWQALSAEYERMLGRLGFEASETLRSRTLDKLEALISLAYTRETLTEVRADWRKLLNGRTETVETVDPATTSQRAKLPDGSLRYDLAYRQRGENVVRAAAEEDGRNLVTESLTKGNITDAKIARFSALISHLTADNIKMTFVLPPFHPVTYTTAQAGGAGPYLARLTEIYNGIAAENGITVLGGYDPMVAGCSESSFYDGIHPDETCMRHVLSYAPLETGQ